MKDWQLYLAIFILIILIGIKAKETFENNQIVYDIHNTINYNESNYNVMNRGMIEKNKNVIKEEDELVQKNKGMTIKIPECNNSIIERTYYYNNVAIPNLMNAEEELRNLKKTNGLREQEYNTLVKTLADRNKTIEGLDRDNARLEGEITGKQREFNRCEQDKRILQSNIDNKNNLPTGTYTIKSVKNNRYCRDAKRYVMCDFTDANSDAHFYMENLGGKWYSMKSGRNKMFCADDDNTRHGRAVLCNRSSVGGWERYHLSYIGGGVYSIHGGRDSLYCSNSDGDKFECNRGSFLDWEKFIIERL
jgi:hypothetical protein